MTRHALTVHLNGLGQWRAWCLLCSKGGKWRNTIGEAKADCERHARKPDKRPIDQETT